MQRGSAIGWGFCLSVLKKFKKVSALFRFQTGFNDKAYACTSAGFLWENEN